MIDNTTIEAIIYDSGVDLVIREGDYHRTIAEWDADSGEFVDHPWDNDPEYHAHMLKLCEFHWSENRGRMGTLED